MTNILLIAIIKNVSYLTKGSGIIKSNKNIAFEIKILDNMISRKIINDCKELNLPFDISPVQLKILNYLLNNQNKVISQSHIEKIIASRRSTTSGILNTMEKNNLIKRLNNPNDARAKQIVLTTYSTNIAMTFIKEKNQFDKKIKNNITNEELKVFFKVTDKIKNNIINMK